MKLQLGPARRVSAGSRTAPFLQPLRPLRAFRWNNGIFRYTIRAVAPPRSLQAFKAEFFKALAHPVRIRILEILLAGDQSVQELQEALDLDQPTVSQQLAVLRAKNVVVANKVGTSVRYAVSDPLVGDLLAVARRIFNNQLVGSQSMLRELRRELTRR